MAFNHKLLATEGLFPGLFSTYSFAVLGTFLIEVIIEPQPPKPDLGYADLEYKVTIRIRRKDKVWETSRYVSYFSMKSIENVVITFNKINKLYTQFGVNVTLINKRIREIFVKVKKHE